MANVILPAPGLQSEIDKIIAALRAKQQMEFEASGGGTFGKALGRQTVQQTFPQQDREQLRKIIAVSRSLKGRSGSPSRPGSPPIRPTSPSHERPPTGGSLANLPPVDPKLAQTLERLGESTRQTLKGTTPKQAGAIGRQFGEMTLLPLAKEAARSEAPLRADIGSTQTTGAFARANPGRVNVQQFVELLFRLGGSDSGFFGLG